MTVRRVPSPEGPFRFRRPIEVRFRDTDALGHVNNAVYLTYFEAARASYYAEVTGAGLDFLGEGGQVGIGFIMAEARVSFVSPARFGEPLELEARVDWLSRSSFGITYRVTAPGRPAPDTLVAFGETVQVMFDYRSAKVVSIPGDLVERLEAYEERRLRPSAEPTRKEGAGLSPG